MFDIYQTITDKIIKKLEEGKIPWKKQWAVEMPKNFLSKKPYSGMNFLLLQDLPYKSPYYLTFLQAKQLGGSIKTGEKGHMVIFWKILEFGEDEEDLQTIPLLRYYTVFNFEQTEGIKPIEEEKINNPIEKCEQIIAEYKTIPKIQYGGAKAYYSPVQDYIQLPVKDNFDSSEAYYSTLFHECIHSTGHKSRLDRKEGIEKTHFGSADYSKEELVAEIGSAFLCSKAHIVTKQINSQVAYVQNWIQVLKNDKRFIISAAAKATKASQYILGEYTKYDTKRSSN